MRGQPHPLAAFLAVCLILGPPTVPLFADTIEALAGLGPRWRGTRPPSPCRPWRRRLSETTRDQPSPLLDLLRQAYAAAAREADSRGLKADAELYRDNLEILDRNHPAPHRWTISLGLSRPRCRSRIVPFPSRPSRNPP